MGMARPGVSSSRAGGKALIQLIREIRNDHDVGFTVDGPRGPRFIAKQGPVILARKTGAGIFCFHIALKRKIQLNSWDQFQIPLPFTRAMVFTAPPIWDTSGRRRVCSPGRARTNAAGARSAPGSRGGLGTGWQCRLSEILQRTHGRCLAKRRKHCCTLK